VGGGTAVMGVDDTMPVMSVAPQMQATRAAARADKLLGAQHDGTITASDPNATSLTHAPGSPSIRFNAVVTRTSPPSQTAEHQTSSSLPDQGGGGSPSTRATCETPSRALGPKQ
jgi:hypothetical protein